MKPRKNDLILIILLLMIAFAVMACVRFMSARGAEAVVLVDGQEQARYALDIPGEYMIESPCGKNILHIENGFASVTEADCPDKICVHTSPVHLNGETIVCLPHRVVIEIRGGEEGAFDAVAK